MAPQTRSAAKPSPGRLTRNSVYGRPPPLPSKPRKSVANGSPAEGVLVRDAEAEGRATSDVGNTKGTPWLACRDPYGVFTAVAVSETGEGIHIRWYYPEDDHEADEDEDAEVEMIVDEERAATPLATTAAPSHDAPRPFPQTPMALFPYDAGSVIRTPVKRARPLQRSPPRIGDKGIRCLYEKGGVLRELDGAVRLVLRHPIGSSANLSREQVEQLEREREDKIIRVQVEKLLEEKRRLEEEEKQFSDSGYEDEMEIDVPPSQRGLEREGTNDTVLVSHDELPSIDRSASVEEVESALGFFRGPNGELLDRHGHQMFGKEGTLLLDSAQKSPRRVRREEAFRLSVDDFAREANELHWPARLGREGTELID